MPKATRRPDVHKTRSQIIATVQSPLGFFVLVVLVTEVALGLALAARPGADSAYLLRAMVLLIFALVLIVGVLAAFRPEALKAERIPQPNRTEDGKRVAEQQALTYNPITLRGISLLEAAERAGLQDIENRDDDKFSLPPETIYTLVKHEIVISGVTLAGTFSKHVDHLIRLMREQRDVFIVLCLPGSKALLVMGDRVARELDSELNATLHTIRARKLHVEPHFHVKFVDELPFTAVMVDGDVNGGDRPHDDTAIIRVQPRGVHTSQHRGLVLQLAKRSTPPRGIIEFFAADVRYQWQTLAKARPDIFEHAAN